MKKVLLAGLLALTAVSAAACGRMADLEAPQPRKTERATRDAGSPKLPDPATINRPPSQMPIDGGPSNPFGGSAAGRDPR